MVVVSTIQKLLLLFRYPSFSPDLIGPHEVGVIQRRIPDSTACQIFYPATPSSGSNNLPYFRPEAVSGLADYTDQSEDLISFLSKKKHPCLVDAAPLEVDQSGKQSGFPVVLFSHGLGGCMEMYTDICQQVASTGKVVIAMEHEDGSGCYAESPSGKKIFYKRPDDAPYSRHKVVNFRRPFLQQRVQEIVRMIDFVSLEKTVENDAMLNRVLQCVDRSKGVALFGHSFGAASMALTAIQQKTASSLPIQSLSMLDPWAFSLDDDTVKGGIPPELPCLTILSEGWVTNAESLYILEFHKDRPSDLYYMPDSVHASFSDSAWWLPRFITRRMGLRGAKEPRHKTVRACAVACARNIESTMSERQNSETAYSGIVPAPYDDMVEKFAARMSSSTAVF